MNPSIIAKLKPVKKSPEAFESRDSDGRIALAAELPEVEFEDQTIKLTREEFESISVSETTEAESCVVFVRQMRRDESPFPKGSFRYFATFGFFQLVK